MDYIIKDYYVMKRNGSSDMFCVELLHRTNNLYAAKKAMLNTYGLTESNIMYSRSCPCSGMGYSTFDGTKFD